MKKKITIIICALVILTCIAGAIGIYRIMNDQLSDEFQLVGTFPSSAFDTAVAFTNPVDATDTFGLLNPTKLADRSVKHLPIYRLDTFKDFKQFKKLNDIFTFDLDYREDLSFDEAMAKYDRAFFKKNSLMLVYVPSSSGSYRFRINNVFCDGWTFCIHMEQIKSSDLYVTMDEQGWFFIVAVPDSMVDPCVDFDADLDNIAN